MIVWIAVLTVVFLILVGLIFYEDWKFYRDQKQREKRDKELHEAFMIYCELMKKDPIDIPPNDFHTVESKEDEQE